MKYSVYPGRYVYRRAKSNGFDVSYRSFNFNVFVHFCWTNTEKEAEETANRLNAQLYEEVLLGHVKIEEQLKRTARLIEKK